MRIRVAIDVTSAVTQRAGVGRYTRELVQALKSVQDGADLRPFYVAPRASYPLGGDIVPTGVHRPIRPWRLEMMARLMLRLPAHGPWDGAQVYHAPDVVYPLPRRIPVVSTVHDLSYVAYPRYHTRFNGTYLRLVTPAAARRARLIIAVSNATKHDLICYYHVPEDKIRVVHSGVAAVFARRLEEGRIAEVRRRHDLMGPFILSVGTLEPRKNVRGVLEGYRLLRERMPDVPPLVLVGASGWRLDERTIFTPAEMRNVRRLNYVPDQDLAALYASCSAFVYPSLYEGWGLPVAEAMSQGAPTVTSNVSALPEVAGDAALLVDPHEAEALATALQRILEDDDLALRLRTDGPRQAQRFSAQAWADATSLVYREALEG